MSKKVALKFPPLRNSHLTYGPQWPRHRTDNDTGSRYIFSEASNAWIFSCGPEDC